MSSYKLLLVTLSFATIGVSVLRSQHHGGGGQTPKFRAALLLGHTLITPHQSDDHLFIPSWGVDVEYWPGPKLGVGIHSDIELESFIISDGENERIQRINPIVVTLDALYRPWKGVVLLGGPGVELEQSDTYELFRLGVEYEVEFGNHFDLSPTMFYDQRFDGYSTISIALGIGKRF